MIQRILIMVGIGCIIIGVLWPFIMKLGLGKLPGDIYISGKSFKFYFPITTCILVSLVITLILWLLRK